MCQSQSVGSYEQADEVRRLELQKGHEVTVRPLSPVGNTSVVASVIHSRQWSN